MFPIRCFTCGKVVASKQQQYETKLQNGVSPCDALNALGFHRWCCRRMFLTYINITDQVNEFPRYEDRLSEEKKVATK